MNIFKCECEHCKKRTIWCHSTCESYLAFEEKNRQKNKIKLEKNTEIGNLIDQRYQGVKNSPKGRKSKI